MNTCIAYFTKEGSTELVAKYLARKIGATLVELVDPAKYKGLGGFIKGGFNAVKSSVAKLDTSIYDEIASFDRIILATPVWAGKTTPAINAVLKNVDLSSKEVYVITLQADPDFADHENRKEFYRDIITKKGGTFKDLFSLHGASPGKGPRNEDELIEQINQKINL